MANEELTGLSYESMSFLIGLVLSVIFVFIFWYIFHRQQKLREEIKLLEMELRELKKKDS